MGPVPLLARLIALVLVAAGCVLLVAAEFSTLYEIRVITVVQESTTSGDHHGFALLVIALAAAFMAYGALMGGSRPAAFGLLFLAAAALFVVLAVDFPDVNKEGFLAVAFEQAKATPRTGFYLESLGAVLLLLGAVITIVFGREDADARPGAAARPRVEHGDGA